MYVVGGLIVGSPGDTRKSIEANLEFARRYVDWPYIQHPTPYPRTPMTKDFRDQGLIMNEQLEEYDGTTAVVRTEHLPAEEVEFMRWKAERWMKLHHLPIALRHDPTFVLFQGWKMLAHTFRGSSIRSALGLESERKVFESIERFGGPSANTLVLSDITGDEIDPTEAAVLTPWEFIRSGYFQSFARLALLPKRNS